MPDPKANGAEVRLDRAAVMATEEMLTRCVLRLLISRAPESRALGEEAEEQLLRLCEAIARYDKLVKLHGGEGRRPQYAEPANGEPEIPTEVKT